jgi:hypothetical protein
VRRLTRPLLILIAIVFLIEAWLWRHLGPVVVRVVARIPLRAVKAWTAGALRTLPPPAALVVFIVPVVALFPFKLLGLWLLANQQWLGATVVLVFAKLVGVAITAFVFEVTKPKLLRMAWFRWLYEHVMAWLDWAHRLVDPTKHRIRRLIRVLRAKQTGRALRLLWRIRRRVQAARRAAKVGLSANAADAARSAQAS